MNKELVVNKHTQLCINDTRKKDILEFYGVPGWLDKISQKERSNLLNSISCGGVFINSLHDISHASDFKLEIPSGFRKLINEGKAAFDSSSKSPGSFTPNIRIKGEKGIVGQATITKDVDVQSVARSLSNLALMGMLQSALAKLDVIEKKVDEIINGQKIDRIGIVIGSFRGFMNLYPSIKYDDEMRLTANKAFMNMDVGLAQIHQQIDEYRKILDEAPKDHLHVFWKGFCNPLKGTVKYYQEIYSKFVYDLQLYNRLILLSDVVLYLKGDYEVIERNHKTMKAYCQEYIDEPFIEKMKFLANNHIDGIFSIQNHMKAIDEAIENMDGNLLIECNHNEVQLIKTNDDESKNN